jgi:1-hydroxycarotenoid 3,4-desaturase
VALPNFWLALILVATLSLGLGLFPATGGALYGRANHGWQAPFQRPGSASRLPGLYLAGGGTHPGAGIPMASLSGRLAADRLLADLPSMPSSQPGDTPGGTSTRSATTAATA